MLGSLYPSLRSRTPRVLGFPSSPGLVRFRKPVLNLSRLPIPSVIVLQEFKGYIFKIMGGNDKQGFGMKQGVLTASRVFLLMTR